MKTLKESLRSAFLVALFLTAMLSPPPGYCEHTSRASASAIAQAGEDFGDANGGSSLVGAPATSNTWYFAAGCAGDDRNAVISIDNPGGSQADVSVVFYTRMGEIQGPEFSVSPYRSASIDVSQYLTEDEVGAKVSSSQPVLARRTIYSEGRIETNPGATSLSTKYLFAEGYVGSGFAEEICVINPGDADATLTLEYHSPTGPVISKNHQVKSKHRTTISVNDDLEDAGFNDVFLVLTSPRPVFAERVMTFTYQELPVMHVSPGSPAAAGDWYFPPVSAAQGFTAFLANMNLEGDVSELHVGFLLDGGANASADFSVPARSRFSVSVNADVAAGQDVSAYVHSDLPIVCERPMYFNYGAVYNPGRWPGGHVVMGAASPGREWYFAEGCTRAGFEEWICIQNPNPAEAHLHVAYATCSGVEERDYTVPANSRHTLSLNAELGPDLDVSCHITSDQPIICERPLYFNYTGRGAPGWSGGSAELGVTAPRTTWHFAEGYTGPGFHEWICLQNTGDAEAEVTVTYNIQGEGPRERAHRVPPGRYTICVNEDAGADLQLSASVTSDQPLICERSMYFSYGSGWSGGHCASGF